MKRWQGPCIGAFLVFLICGATMFFVVPVGGAILIGIPPVFDKLTAQVVCPGAVSISQQDYNAGPVTTSPSGMTGYQEELTCTFADGTQRVVPNEEIAFKGMGASFTAVGICSGLIVLVLMAAAAVIGGRLVHPKNQSL